MPEVLGRVTTRIDVPRGPDAQHRIRVPRAWLEAGVEIELELPRHLMCAACDGGGCDSCERSGAVTVRGRHELAELLSVTLPRKGRGPEVPLGVVIRIPEQGGLAAVGLNLPRGFLLLRVESAEIADPGVARVGSLVPAPILQRVVHSLRVAAEAPKRRRTLVLALVVLVVSTLACLVLWRLRR